MRFSDKWLSPWGNDILVGVPLLCYEFQASYLVRRIRYVENVVVDKYRFNGLNVESMLYLIFRYGTLQPGRIMEAFA